MGSNSSSLNKSKTAFSLGAALLLLGAAVLFLYGPSLRFGFLWDDYLLIVDNPALNQNPIAFFGQPLYPMEAGEQPYYRPLQMVSHFVDFRLFGLNPWGSHAVNLLLFGFNLFLTAWIFKRLTGLGWLGAAGTAILFGAHPMHTPAVVYISGRADLLVYAGLTGMLAAFLKGWRVLSWFSFALALGSKESALLGPGLIALAQWSSNRWAFKGLRVKPLVPYLLLAGGWLLWRQGALSLPIALPEALPWIARVREFPNLLAAYLSAFFNPFHPQLSRAVASTHQTGVLTACAWAGVTGLLAAGFVWLWVRKPVSRFWLGWTALMGLPLTRWAWPLAHPAADHWMILPAVGVFGLIGLAAARLKSRSSKGLSFAALVIWGLLCWQGTSSYVRKWADPLTLYAYQLKENPALIRTHANYAEELLTQGHPADAVEESLKALAKKGDAHHPWLVISRASLVMGRFPQARDAAQAALSLKPTEKGFLLLGAAHYELGEAGLCEEELQKAVALAPSFELGWEALGDLYYEQGRWTDALKAYGKLVELKPQSKAYRDLLADAYESWLSQAPLQSGGNPDKM
ncbi:MAG: tetratricopeptide repeat protein [Candidatus Omnitrophica bacterium]|nr:tetratricopeptide repeat protein [Candidatus Omnitrophota bacterium]